MVAHALELMTVIGVLLVGLMQVCQWRRLHATWDGDRGDWPPVTVLKPLKGVDADLESNLTTFFDLDYPSYELVFGVQDPADPALTVAREVASRRPEVPVRFVVDDRQVGFNPKVNNLANTLEVASYELILISDSNVAAPRDHLQRMVSALLQPDVGMVTTFFRGTGGSGLGAALEGLQLNTFVMAGVALVSSLPRTVCAVGKSMLLRRSDLEEIGGFVELGRYLAEDQVCGEAVRDHRLRVAVSAGPVDNVLGHLTLRCFASRHLRWARIRRHIAPVAYASEVLTVPMLPAAANLLLFPAPRTVAFAAGTLLVLSLLALRTERLLGVRRHPLLYPGLELMRGLMVAVLWPVPFVSSTVSWRGNRFRVRRRTLLEPLSGEGHRAAA
jgi:ceramide glucosyltransferase